MTFNAQEIKERFGYLPGNEPFILEKQKSPFGTTAQQMSLYSEMFYSSEAAVLFSDGHFIGLMLQVEAALARAQATNGLVPESAADTIGDCCKASEIDLELLKTEVKLGGNAAIPLVKQLTQLVKKRDAEAVKFVHLGATSQDVVDTATVLQIREFCTWADQKLSLLEEVLAALTRKHRNTLMIGRTLLQQAKPITFGLKTAGWLESIGRSRQRILEIKKHVSVIQLAGAVGSGNPHISKAVQQAFADILGLDTAHSWHSHRDRFAESAAVFGILTGSIGKIATDVALLMQTEVGEVLEGAADGKGGSSTMPHKRNPVTCAAILANANRTPQLVATMLAAMPQEHERSAGLWHSEWEVLSEIMQLTAGAIERAIELVAGLEVDEKRMLHNLELTHGLIYAENVSLALAPVIGKAAAHELVEKACKTAVAGQKHLKEILLEASEGMTLSHLLTINPAGLNDLFKPENAIGSSLEIIDDILAKFAKQ